VAVQKLSKTVVDELVWDPAGASTQIVWDDSLTNFGVRVYESGHKTYLWAHTNSSGQYRIGRLGKVGLVTFTQAKEQAKQLLSKVSVGTTSKPIQIMTFKAAATIWVDQYAKKHRKAWEHVRDYVLFPHRPTAPAYKLHNLKLRKGGRADFFAELDAVCQAYAETAPRASDYLGKTVQAVLNWHVKKGNLDPEYRDIAYGLDPYKPTKVDKSILPDEFKKLAFALAAESLEDRCAIWLSLFVGARMKSEVWRLRWENIHLDSGVFTFHDTKTTPHELPITPMIRVILDALPRTSEWLFPSSSSAGHRTEDRRLAGRLRKNVKFAHPFTIHSLRHTCRTFAISYLEIPEGTVNALTNHAGDSRTASSLYVHTHRQNVSQAIERIAAFMLEKAGIDDFEAHIQKAAI
jgi:integrase